MNHLFASVGNRSFINLNLLNLEMKTATIKISLLILILISFSNHASAQFFDKLKDELMRNMPKIDVNKANENQKSTNSDKLLQKFYNDNPHILEYSKKQSDNIQLINSELLKISIQDINDCQQKKFRFKSICLGMTIQDFSKVLAAEKIEIESGFDTKEILKNLNVGNLRTGPNPRKKIDCEFSSPSVRWSDSIFTVNISLPIGLRILECTGKNTLLGEDLENTNFIFLNERLYSIGIYFNDWSDVTYLQNVKETYENLFASNSSINEIISSVSEEKVNTKNMRNARCNQEYTLSTWLNEKDGTEFNFKMANKCDRFIGIFSTKIDKAVTEQATNLKNFLDNRNLQNKKKDF